ncbi:methyl-accepting chemotaxis protein [Halomonas sp. MCCC 1A17488]|uniref:methyl-accepting chemotaxis protein n=1 Tax=unclassified Halomonas TaxID=2609666 RepID=UPI0018D24110|nr:MULTISPECIES: methyl-accepting chemotaxis protein [unclassified Halomonas]MCE8014591.1 methyl-accepting chemotaxis protein [Halomonas sp. MCCC 1A17488]MCG3237924.1 methyl-accepting chemotaxis protein [Halomonas sp. MCCC 1A17488]QPP48291.1 MCP four helix bundle domain-containing protein [Halomonas sp. SS10-MC5]
MKATNASLARLGIRTRLLLGFSAVLALIVLLTAIGIVQVNRIDRSLTTINDINGVKLRHAIDWRGSVHDRAILLRDMTLVETQPELAALQRDYRALADDYRLAANGMNEMTRESVTPREQELLAAVERQAEATQRIAAEVMEQREQGNFAAARERLLSAAGPAFFAWLDSINAFIDHQEAESAADSALARDTAAGFQMLMLALCLAAMLLGGGIAYLLARQLLRELGAEPHEVRAFAEAIGRGELATAGRLRKNDEHSIMAAQVGMARQLQEIVAQVRAAAEAVASNSEQIAEGNTDLASRTQQQASALTQTASAMEELNGTVVQNTENAGQASREAESASHTARQGGVAVEQMAATMNELDRSAGEIASIISTIDDIAFQTNILALNASVEAARAGEHGRGFAVVAAEVRKLAQKSADAAKEINELITSNVERVKSGNTRAAEARQATEEIVEAIARVSQLMREISQASVEQSAGVQEAGTAVAEMDRVTQQNATLVNESATAAGNLRQHAQQLMTAMAAFQLPNTARTDGQGATNEVMLTAPRPIMRQLQLAATERQPEWANF